MRILFVEDDDRIAQPLAEDLRRQYYVVDLAEDGVIVNKEPKLSQNLEDKCDCSDV